MHPGLQYLSVGRLPYRERPNVPQTTLSASDKNVRGRRRRRGLSRCRPWGYSLPPVDRADPRTLLVLRYPALHEEQSDSITYTQEEILAARDQARWSLAYVANTIQENEKKTIEDVFIDKLPRVVRDCIRNTVPLFKGGQQ